MINEKKNPHIGTTLESLFEELGESEEVKKRAEEKLEAAIEDGSTVPFNPFDTDTSNFIITEKDASILRSLGWCEELSPQSKSTLQVGIESAKSGEIVPLGDHVEDDDDD